jgi:hypothetical protein
MAYITNKQIMDKLKNIESKLNIIEFNQKEMKSHIDSIRLSSFCIFGFAIIVAGLSFYTITEGIEYIILVIIGFITIGIGLIGIFLSNRKENEK